MDRCTIGAFWLMDCPPLSGIHPGRFFFFTTQRAPRLTLQGQKQKLPRSAKGLRVAPSGHGSRCRRCRLAWSYTMFAAPGRGSWGGPGRSCLLWSWASWRTGMLQSGQTFRTSNHLMRHLGEREKTQSSAAALKLRLTKKKKDRFTYLIKTHAINELTESRKQPYPRLLLVHLLGRAAPFPSMRLMFFTPSSNQEHCAANSWN